jgi:small subunit ribosomal protein S21
MSDIKKNQHFEKPSDRRKRKMNQAIRRNRKKQQRRR